MGGGLMQLVAYGAQDIYLTGNPQITFFKVVYRRHTNFSMEAISQTLNGSTASGGSQTVTISRNGDLVSACYIQMKDGTFGMQEGEAYDLVDSVELEIGGQRIDKHYGDWNAIWWELTTPESKVNGLRNMLIENSGSVDGSTAQCYYPLNFWFCRNPGLALPLIALQYHEVKVKITWGTVPTSGTADFYVDYIYLDTDERRRFAQQSHEYLIEQVQRQTNGGDSQKIKLNFNHPVKEIVWVNAGSSNGYAAGCQFAPLRNNTSTATDVAYTPANNDDEINIKLTLNGHDRFAQREAKYFKSVQPYQHHTRIPAPSNKIQRDCHISHLGAAAICAETSEGLVLIPKINKTSRITGANVFTQEAAAASATLTLYHGSTFAAGNEDNTERCLDVSASVALSDTTMNGNTDDITTANINANYTSIVPSGNAIAVKASTTLGAFSGKFTIEYEELPTLIAGDAANTADIYCYSFALKPEEHQPSGTCNFSRIDSAYLEGDQNLAGSNRTVKVFAVNYNVLRIMSGMGGLAYSN
jgi:hypothetical protein